MVSNAAIWFMLILGLTKAALFALFVRWCLKNDQNGYADGGPGGGEDGIAPLNPYSPSWTRVSWRRLSRISYRDMVG